MQKNARSLTLRTYQVPLRQYDETHSRKKKLSLRSSFVTTERLLSIECVTIPNCRWAATGS